MNQPTPIPPDRLVSEEIIPGGAMWSGVIKRHHTLRLTDLYGGANAAALFFNRDQLLDRLNLPDTLKALHTAKLTRGHTLMSDMGRVLCSISADNLGWHDPLGGHSDAALVRSKYEPSSFQTDRNAFHRNSRDQFLIELAKWGLGNQDLVANVNFFSKVAVDDDGQMEFAPGHSPAEAFVDLRAEMNVLAVLNTCQHPMDPFPTCAPKPVRLTIFRSDPPAPDDFCRHFRPENTRAFQLTEALFA
jgi:urea carboxylase-associated protein 2